MEIVTYRDSNSSRFGALVDGSVQDIARASAAYHATEGTAQAIPDRIEAFRPAREVLP